MAIAHALRLARDLDLNGTAETFALVGHCCAHLYEWLSGSANDEWSSWLVVRTGRSLIAIDQALRPPNEGAAMKTEMSGNYVTDMPHTAAWADKEIFPWSKIGPLCAATAICCPAGIFQPWVL